MNIVVSHDSDGTVRLAGSLLVYEVESVCRELLPPLATQPALHLDLTEVTECDAAGLQVLLAARRSAGVAGKPFRVLAASPALAACADALGVAPDFLS